MEDMNLVIGSSKEYSKYALVMLTSLFENNSDYAFSIYYYYHEEMNEMLTAINELCEMYGNKLYPMFVEPERMEGTDKIGTWHNSTWYRWLCLDDLYNKCERALIIGIDIIVSKDISSFYFQDLGDKCMAAIQDSINMYEWYSIFDECSERNKSVDDYVNTDVVLIDIKRTKELFSLEKLIDIHSESGVMCNEQGVINYFYSDYLKIIKDSVYNFGVNAAYEMFDEGEYTKMVDDAAILHYAGRKPWSEFDNSYAHNVWLSYAKSTKYSDYFTNAVITCNTKNMYREYIKSCTLFFVLNSLWSACENGRLISNLEEKSMRNIAVYGYGAIGKKLVAYLVKNNIRVEYIIDKQNIENEYGISRISVDEIDKTTNIDAIIITPVNFYKSIKKDIEKKGNYKCYSLTELL